MLKSTTLVGLLSTMAVLAHPGHHHDVGVVHEEGMLQEQVDLDYTKKEKDGESYFLPEKPFYELEVCDGKSMATLFNIPVNEYILAKVAVDASERAAVLIIHDLQNHAAVADASKQAVLDAYLEKTKKYRNAIFRLQTAFADWRSKQDFNVKSIRHIRCAKNSDSMELRLKKMLPLMTDQQYVILRSAFRMDPSNWVISDLKMREVNWNVLYYVHEVMSELISKIHLLKFEMAKEPEKYMREGFFCVERLRSNENQTSKAALLAKEIHALGEAYTAKFKNDPEFAKSSAPIKYYFSQSNLLDTSSCVFPEDLRDNKTNLRKL